MKGSWKSVLYLGGALGLLVSLSAQASLITFEETGTKTCCFASEPDLTDQYASLGVNFSGQWAILNQSGNFGVNALSGEHFAAFNNEVTTDTLGISFDNAVGSVSGYLGSLFASNWSINWYLNGVNQGFLEISNQASDYVMLNLSNITADYLTIQSDQYYGVLDDLSFEGASASVPEPSSLALLSLGLAGFGFSRKKKAH